MRLASIVVLDKVLARLGRTGAVTSSILPSGTKAGMSVTMSKHYLLLAAAIVAEVIATTALSRSENLTRLIPSLIVVIGYAAAFWLLSFSLRVMPTGIVYAIWSGMGIVLITAIGWIWYQQKMDLPALAGMGLIMAGVIVINVFSKTVSH
jgi:small multidrug resistance pump